VGVDKMKYFEHDYTMQSESTPTEKVLCMRCAKLVQGTGFREFPSPANKSKIIYAIFAKPLSNLRQVPFLVDFGGRVSVVHLLLCQDCEKFEFKKIDGPKIIRQIIRAEQISRAWARYPQAALDAVEVKWGKAEVLRRLYGKEAESEYLKRG